MSAPHAEVRPGVHFPELDALIAEDRDLAAWQASTRKYRAQRNVENIRRRVSRRAEKSMTAVERRQVYLLRAERFEQYRQEFGELPISKAPEGAGL